MTDENSTVVDIRNYRDALPVNTQHSNRAAAEDKRWLEIWEEAWAFEGARRGKSLQANERNALAQHIQRMVNEIKRRHGNRSGKVAAALAGGPMTEDEAQDRGCPRRLLQSVTAEREYRIDRFTNKDAKLLRGKLLDWLRVTELLAMLLDRDLKREVIQLYDESRVEAIERERSGLSDSYDAIFKSLNEQLLQIAAGVARESDAATFYECCDKMHAAWFEGEIIEDDGWFARFKRNEFEQYEWVEADRGPYGNDPAAWSPLGAVGEMLIHTPLARVTLAHVEVTDTMRDGGVVGQIICIDCDIHLALRPDVDDPREAGALLLHPLITTHDPDLVHSDEKKPFRWWRDFKAVSLEGLSEAAIQEIFEAAHIMLTAGDQHMERATKMARKHVGKFCLMPLTDTACQAWLSFGSNTVAEEFAEFFWHVPATSESYSDIVSAPSGTLAGHIQFNLIMADAGGQGPDRIDRRLAVDARRKTEALKTLLERKRLNYESRLEDAGFTKN